MTLWLLNQLHVTIVVSKYANGFIGILGGGGGKQVTGDLFLCSYPIQQTCAKYFYDILHTNMALAPNHTPKIADNIQLNTPTLLLGRVPRAI